MGDLFRIKSGVGFVVSIDELGTPALTTDINEATLFNESQVEFAVAYMKEAGFGAEVVKY